MMTELMRKDLEKRIDQWIAGKKSTIIEGLKAWQIKKMR